jgi:hypothetical protein
MSTDVNSDPDPTTVIVLCSAMVFCVVVLSVWFWTRRFHFPIATRWPSFVIMGELNLVLALVILNLATVYKNTIPCYVTTVAVFDGVSSAAIFCLLRAWKLYYDYRITLARAENLTADESWFLRYYKYSKPEWVKYTTTFCSTFHKVVGVILVLTVPVPDGKMCADLLYPTFGFLMVYLILQLILSFFLRNLKDGTFVALELLFNAVVAIVTLTIIVILHMNDVNYSSLLWIADIDVYITFVTSFIAPIIGSYAIGHSQKMILRESQQPKVSDRGFPVTSQEDLLPDLKTIHMEDILSSERGIQAFKDFLISEFSVENLLFWIDVAQFKRIYSEDKNEKLSEDLTTAALRIYNRYIKKDCEYEVNIEFAIADKIHRAFNNPADDTLITPNIFDQAYEEIQRLMELDSFSRFKRTLQKQTWVIELQERLHHESIAEPSLVKVSKQ